MGFVAVLFAAAAMWAFYMVAAFRHGSYGLGAINGLLLIGSVWTIMRIMRRRRRQDT
jgi:hypothetical protein